jgi:hypothetical protein
MAAIEIINHSQDEDDYFSFSGNLICIKRHETNQFPFLKNMVESELKRNCIDGVYHVTIDVNHFMCVYNYVIFGIEPKSGDYDTFTKIYKYIFCGKEIEKVEKVKEVGDDFEILYEAFNVDIKLFKKLVHKHFISDDISLTSSVRYRKCSDGSKSPKTIYIYNGTLIMETKFGKFDIAESNESYDSDQKEFEMYKNSSYDYVVEEFNKDELLDSFGIKYVFKKYCVAIEKYLSKEYAD